MESEAKCLIPKRSSHYTISERREYLRSYNEAKKREPSLSKAQYCKNKGLNASTFYAWLKKYNTQVEKKSEIPVLKEANFQTLHLKPKLEEKTSSSSKLSLKLKLGGFLSLEYISGA